MIRQLMIITCLLISQNSMAVTAGDLPPGFTASYTFFKNGLAVAERQYVFEKKPNMAKLTSKTTLSGLASLFSDDKIIESSEISFLDNTVQVSDYSYRQTGKKTKTIISSFDINTKKVRTIIDSDTEMTSAFEIPTWDKLSNFILLMSAIQTETQQLETNTLDEGQIKHYTLLKTGHREIEINDDDWRKTVTWERRDSGKSIIFYLNPNAHFLPLKIEQFKDGNLRATLLLNSIKWQESRTIAK